MGIDKERKVNVEKMSNEQVDNLSERLGNKIADILNKAAEDCNRLMNVYGLEILVNYKMKPNKAKQPKKVNK